MSPFVRSDLFNNVRTLFVSYAQYMSNFLRHPLSQFYTACDEILVHFLLETILDSLHGFAG